MTAPDFPPTLAALRRKLPASARRVAAQPVAPGLFDDLGLPSPEAEATETAGSQPVAPANAHRERSGIHLAEESLDGNSRTAEQPTRSPGQPPSLSLPSQDVPVIAAAGVQKAIPSGSAAPKPPAQPWTVSGLVRHVRGLVEQGYGQVIVEGEISNWRPAGSGHCYFTVKDLQAQLSAVIFRRHAALLRFSPQDGAAVRLNGQLSVYEGRGQMQLIVERMQPAGIGVLLAEVQRLKEALRREGLFDRKRPLPPFPRCIGVITSLHGAALRDIVKVCRRRHAAVQLLIYPVAVQGPSCPAEVVTALRWFNAHPGVAEVVLVARGGGSWEDLHGFDHEGVARAIADCVLPVMTGIGHATDTTIADAVADRCAPTPSAAAELLTGAQHGVEERIARLHSRLLRAGRFEVLRAQQRFARTAAAALLPRVEAGLNRRAQQVDELTARTWSAAQRHVRSSALRHGAAETRLRRHHPGLRLQIAERRLEALTVRLERAAATRTGASGRRWSAARVSLEALSPLRVLDRGYALLYGESGHLLHAAAQARPGEVITGRLAQGTLRAQVLETAPTSGKSPAGS